MAHTHTVLGLGCWGTVFSSQAPMAQGAKQAPMAQGAKQAPIAQGAKQAPMAQGAKQALDLEGEKVRPRFIWLSLSFIWHAVSYICLSLIFNRHPADATGHDASQGRAARRTRGPVRSTLTCIMPRMFCTVLNILT